MRPCAVAIMAVISISLLSGCVEQSAHGDATVFRFERWLPLTVLGGCVVGIPIAWWLRTRIAKLGYGLLIMIPVALLIAVPGLWCDRVAIDQ
ncbi:MAG: hypothetical protein L0219_00885, partial [Phycisphaerales bacterium]|nr:hypothetical protein [Phycisphaerales bacterium]